MTYLVHVWFDAPYKERVGGTECGHQGMERVLKHISNKAVKIKTAEKLAPNVFPVCLFTHMLLTLWAMKEKFKSRKVEIQTSLTLLFLQDFAFRVCVRMCVCVYRALVEEISRSFTYSK